MKSTYKLIWSDEALNNLKYIIDYLENRWTKREIKKFALLLDKQLKLIEDNPFLFAESDKSNGLRKSVLSKQTTIYYRIIGYEIRIITLFDNRQNPKTLIDK
ncbi:MAG TPA: type II toxin-antitoxin system RelE/ParE family toxin [Salinivirgaceae bacterium]|jgi:plasmid stabilization system protein ParE|nr:type II toxin-antitoxin system RelE/ParE family toxin [Salinivirgaceae bacterium]